jgi:hypothetical protein
VSIEPGRKVAQIESVRLLSDTVAPGQELKAFVTLKPYKGQRETIDVAVPIPADFPEGPVEAVFCDAANSTRRAFRNDPSLLEPHDLAGLFRSLKLQTGVKRTELFVHVPAPERGLSVKGQELPNLPGSVRAVFASKRVVPISPIRSDRIATVPTRWVIEGMQSLRFSVAKDAGLTLSLYH